MPHCIVEFSSNIYCPVLAKNTLHFLNSKMIESNLFDRESIKLRAVPVAVYLNGGEYLPFLHVTVKLLEGRTAVVK